MSPEKKQYQNTSNALPSEDSTFSKDTQRTRLYPDTDRVTLVVASDTSIGMLNSWRNPQKRKRRLAAIHSDSAQRKRSRTIYNHLQDDLEWRRNFQNSGVIGNQQKMRARMESVFGAEPRQSIINQITRSGSIKKTAKETGVPFNTLRRWMEHLEITREDL